MRRAGVHERFFSIPLQDIHNTRDTPVREPREHENIISCYSVTFKILYDVALKPYNARSCVL